MKTNTDLNPDHNIWNNNGTFWCHFTVHNPDYTKERVRVSLHTKDRIEARQRRDFIMRGTSAIITTLPRTRGQVCAIPSATAWLPEHMEKAESIYPRRRRLRRDLQQI